MLDSRKQHIPKSGIMDLTVNERLAEIGWPPGTVQTSFEFMDLDEGQLKLPP